MSEASRTARINEAFYLIERTARAAAGKGKLPRGVNLDDLCSVGGEQLMKAADKYETDGKGRPWLGYAATWLKFAYRSYLSSARKKASRSHPLEIEMPDGNSVPRPDIRAKNPADQAAARESRKLGKQALKNAALGAALPPPEEAAVKANEYRAALREAVPPSKLGALLGAMYLAGMGGDVQAARLVFNVMQPAGPPPAQPDINMNMNLPGDDDDE
jgi:hypothetical protein